MLSAHLSIEMDVYNRADGVQNLENLSRQRLIRKFPVPTRAVHEVGEIVA